MTRAAAVTLAAALLLGPGSGRAADAESERKAVEQENLRRAKAGLLPRKEPARPAPSRSSPASSGEIPPAVVSAAPAEPAARAVSAAPPPAPPAGRPPAGAAAGPLAAVVAAARGLSPLGAYGGAEVAIDDGLSGSLSGLSVRSAIRVRAGDVAFVLEPTR